MAKKKYVPPGTPMKQIRELQEKRRIELLREYINSKVATGYDKFNVKYLIPFWNKDIGKWVHNSALYTGRISIEDNGLRLDSTQKDLVFQFLCWDVVTAITINH